MQVSVEESGVIERKLTISVPSSEISQEIEKRLKTIGKTGEDSWLSVQAKRLAV